MWILIMCYYVHLNDHHQCRIDTGDDRRISKDEFTSDALKGVLEKVCHHSFYVGSWVAAMQWELRYGWENLESMTPQWITLLLPFFSLLLGTGIQLQESRIFQIENFSMCIQRFLCLNFTMTVECCEGYD